jgi:hypothetical protein
MSFEVFVSYVDANGTPRSYATPARRITQLAARVARLARVKPVNRAAYATSITIQINRSAARAKQENPA